MRIPCPFCGERDLGEFTYLGEAKERPDHTQADAPAQFFEYVYLRTNPPGPHAELWYHDHGCRSWLCVTRDTQTHQILAARLARDIGESS